MQPPEAEAATSAEKPAQKAKEAAEEPTEKEGPKPTAKRKRQSWQRGCRIFFGKSHGGKGEDRDYWRKKLGWLGEDPIREVYHIYTARGNPTVLEEEEGPKPQSIYWWNIETGMWEEDLESEEDEDSDLKEDEDEDGDEEEEEEEEEGEASDSDSDSEDNDKYWVDPDSFAVKRPCRRLWADRDRWIRR